MNRTFHPWTTQFLVYSLVSHPVLSWTYPSHRSTPVLAQAIQATGSPQCSFGLIQATNLPQCSLGLSKPPVHSSWRCFIPLHTFAMQSLPLYLYTSHAKYDQCIHPISIQTLFKVYYTLTYYPYFIFISFDFFCNFSQS